MLFVQQMNQIGMNYLVNFFSLNNILVRITSLIKTCIKSKHISETHAEHGSTRVEDSVRYDTSTG